MNVFQSCSDLADATPFSHSQGLYLKPVAKLNISVQLPTLKTSGKSISNWEVMEKLRNYIVPEEFTSLKVSKSTLEVVRFEGEIESRSKLSSVLARLDGRSIKLSGFHDSLKVRAAEAKPDFPSRHSWDSFFRDAKNMNEMKPGERPDTIHITNLPCKWFSAKSDGSKPSEYILRKVFETFGEVRCVDIPMVDPFRSQMKSHISGIKMFSNNQSLIFEAYIQYKEYICFVKAMDALRGMKLVHSEVEGKAFSASIKVDFDKSKHMSDSSIKRRRVEREKLMAKEREREEIERKAREEEERKLAEERKRIEAEKEAKLARQREREERRKAKQLERLKRLEADEMNQKIATEERLLLITQRRLESVRLLSELFNRLKEAKEKELNKRSYKKSHEQQKKSNLDKPNNRLELKEKELREKLVKKFKKFEQVDANRSKKEVEDAVADKNPEMEVQVDDFEGKRNNHWAGGGFRRGRGGRWNRRGNNNFRDTMHFRGNQMLPMPFQPMAFRGGHYPERGFHRWSQFPMGGRFEENSSFIHPPFIDPYYIESALNDPYYKYFHKITMGNRRSRSYSSSRSRSKSRSYSRLHSRSRSRSYSRSSKSRSRSRSRRGTRSRRRRRSRSRSRSRTRSRSRSRSHSRSKSRSRSRSKSSSRRNGNRKKQSSRTRSHSPGVSHAGGNKKSNSENNTVLENKDKEPNTSLDNIPSVHSWSKSPSRARSLSWENRRDEPSSSTTKVHHRHKKEKKKKDKKEKKKKKDTR